MDNILKVLKNPSYNFLNTNPDLKHIAFLTLSGSHAYGTNNQNSDIDLRGCLLEDRKYLLGFDQFEQFEDKETDTVIFGLRKFVKLCANGNPNTLELLGTPDCCLVMMNEAGRVLRGHADLFLSKRVISSFGNYANAQLRRLENALCHDVYDEDKKREHLTVTLASQIEHFNQMYTPLKGMKIYHDEKGIYFDVNVEKYPLTDFVKIYSEMSQVMRTYDQLANRNKKKSIAQMNKHMMHLVRLLMTGEDILKGNGIVTRRDVEQELLMDLRNGQYAFDDFFKLVKTYQESFARAANMTKLPEKPPLEKLETLMMSLYEKML